METRIEAAAHWPDIPGYRISAVVSQTELSTVYLAEDTTIPRRVALKVLNPRWASDPGFQERFQREVVLAARLDHPNVIPVYASGEHRGLPYLAMRYVDGPSLADLLRGGRPLDTHYAVQVVGMVAAALDAAHAAGLVHRDVKPSNIMLDRTSGHVYLVDFGIAKDVSGENLTVTGQFVGTLGYAAPEQFEGGPVDGRTDCYALAGVLYHCLTGRPPFAGTAPSAARGAFQPHVTDRRPDLPPELDQVLASAMAADPAQRPTCGEFARAVALVTDTGGAPNTGPRAVPPVPTVPLAHRSASRWRRVVWIAAPVTAAALAAVGLVVVRPWGGDGGLPARLRDRVPAALRHDCEQVGQDEAFPAATDVVSCQDGGRTVLIGMFADHDGTDRAYEAAVSDSGVRRGSGDCTRTPGAEHRYPPVGASRGRVVCASKLGTTSFVWSDDKADTVARSSARDSDDLHLQEAWARWVAIPAYPTPAERALVDLVEQPACGRVPAGDLDRFRDVVAGVQCDPHEDGADTVSYYAFSGSDGVKRSYDGHASETSAPPGVYCADDSPPRGFLGSGRWDIRSADVGGLLCHPAGRSYAVEWTVDPLLLMGVAVGPDPAGLVGWWNGHQHPPQAKIIEALNRTSRPRFPTAQEQALLNHVPRASRVDCLRPSASQVRDNVPKAPVVAVVCGPTRGATIVFYYQFRNRAEMNANYGPAVPGAPDCTSLPPDFSGEAAYRRGSSTGRMVCGKNTGGRWFLSWTDERTNIQVVAFGVDDPAVMVDWWRREAGPA